MLGSALVPRVCRGLPGVCASGWDPSTFGQVPELLAPVATAAPGYACASGPGQRLWHRGPCSEGLFLDPGFKFICAVGPEHRARVAPPHWGQGTEEPGSGPGLLLAVGAVGDALVEHVLLAHLY